ncbi:MAG: hypothetical protein DI585_00020 [Pseudomonas fluorescens]|nr:MAG: hypothetical protein DI585_00020 [Pseudomonas fluorescens]
MANDQMATVKVALPQGGQRAVYHIKPHDTIDLSALNLGQNRIDLLGADVVLTNTQTKSTIVLAQLALYLFSDEDAPTLLGPNGQELSPESMLSHIGKVWEFTARDYLGITSLEKVNDAESANEGNKAALAEKVEAASPTPPVVQNPPAEPPPLDTKKYDNLLEMPKAASGSGMFSIPPRVATETPEKPPEDPQQPGLTFTFEARLLQPGYITTPLSATVDEVRGGGAFETAAYDDRNTTQYSQEIIDVSPGNKGEYVIYADDPTYFTDTTATRIIELTPYMPDGFISKSIVISGLPAGFSIIGATLVGSDWVLNTPTLLSNGTIRLPVVYPTGTPESFTLSINFTASFDASTGLATPASGEISYTITRDVETKVVTVPADGNHFDSNGKLIWAMALNENGTKILGGEKTITVYGGKGNDEVTAGSGNDTLYGGKGNDILNGGGGNDFLQGGEGNDILIGGAGNDTADYTDKTQDVTIDLAALSIGRSTAYVNGVAEDELEGIEHLNGGTGNDTFYGDHADNFLRGGDGNDTLMGRGGNDILDGGNGNDTVSYAYASNGVTVTLNNGNAVVNVATGDNDELRSIENIIGSNYNDTLQGDANANILQGGGGDDTFIFSAGADVIDGGTGRNTLDLSTAAAAVTLDMSTVNGGGYSTLTSGSNVQTVRNIQVVQGSNHNDVITGSAANDQISGGAGNDTLDGSDGDDVIYGGVGNNTLHGGSGIDQVRFDDLTTAVTVTLSSAGTGTATGTSGTSTFDGFEQVYLTNQADTITESTGADALFGLNGNDTFIMLAGDSANDTFDGGNGVDTVDYSAASANLDINLTTGIATGLGTDTLVSIENIVGGSGNDTVRGTVAAANTLDGGAGANTLSYDYLTLSRIVANFSTVNGSGFATVTTYNPSNTLTDTDLVKNFQTVYGGGGNDAFTGNGTGQTFYGGEGNDTFYASAGNDIFHGGNGSDTVDYTTRSENMTATLDASGNATVTFNGISKTDTLTGIENITGGSGNDTITGNDNGNTLRGGAGNDTITGGAGNDFIYGGDGNDTLFGGGGDDTFYGDLGDDTIDGGTGTNTLDFSAITTSVTINQAAGTAVGTGIGSDTFTNIHRFIGGSANDNFTGTSGNDYFNGNSGADIVTATNGNDTYVNVEQYGAASYNARIVADMVAGTVQKYLANASTVTWTDTLVPSNFAHVSTGSYDDIITGNTSSNNINTGAGNDTIYASRGNDNYNGGSGTDSLYYTTLGGNIIQSLVTHTISKNVDNSTDTIQLSGSLATIENIYAGSGNDTFLTNVSGLSAYSRIDGGGGTDTVSFTSGTLNVEANSFANVFKNIEVLDLRNATLAGGDSFQITAADIINMTSARSLTMQVTNGFSAAVSAGTGYTIASDTSSGNTRTVVFSKSGESNVTLNMMTYS